MGSLEKLFDEYGAFFTKEHPARFYFDKVTEDMIAHTARPNTELKETNPINKELRPNETEEVRKFRDINDKQLTGGTIREYFGKCKRIIEQSKITKESVSDVQREYFESNPFVDNGVSLSIDAYGRDVILRQALTHSANDQFIAFPYNPIDIDLPPSAMELNESPEIKPLLISHSDLRNGMGHLIFCPGKCEVKRGDSPAKEEMYFGSDEMKWYRFLPFYEKDSNGAQKLKYSIEDWFVHNTGESLINFIPGERALSKDGKIIYQESLIKSCYDYFHLAAGAIGDDLIVRNRFGHPLTEIMPVDCTSCDGMGHDRGNVSSVCSACKGSKVMTWPGPGETFVGANESDRALNSDGKTVDRVKFYSPDIGFAKHSFEVWPQLIMKGKQAIGLDLMDGSSNESGKAKDRRLETLQDILGNTATQLYRCLDKFRWQVECLLVPFAEDRQRATTMIPQRLSVKDLTTLKEEAEKALPENRIYAHREYYECKYQNNPLMIRVHSLLMDYTPIYVVPQEEINVLLAKNICEPKDLIRKVWATQAIDAVRKDKSIDILEADDLDIFKAMDEYLESRGILTSNVIPLVPINDDGEGGVVGEQALGGGDINPEGEGNALARTVGGSGIIRGLNQDVAKGILSREGGIQAAIIQLGYSRAAAEKLIPVPPTSTPNEDLV